MIITIIKKKPREVKDRTQERHRGGEGGKPHLCQACFGTDIWRGVQTARRQRERERFNSAALSLCQSTAKSSPLWLP